MDVLNVLACIAVVALHVSLPVFVPEHTSSWVTDVWFQACAIFATPIFFMISGANLLGYRERYSTKVFFVKRFLRTGLALLGGSALCYVAFCMRPFGFYGAEAYAVGFSLADFVHRFFTNSINDTYWFLYTILYLYLLTPLLSIIVHNKRLMQYLIALTAIASVGFPLLVHLGLDETVISTSLSWPLFADRSLMYYLLGGYIVCHRPLRDKRIVSKSLAAFVCATILMANWALASNGYFSGSLRDGYDGYAISTASPLCVVQAVSLFLLFENLEPRLRCMSQPIRDLLSHLSGASLAVYLIHILLINVLPVGRLEGFVGFIHYNECIELVSVYLLSMVIGIIWKTLKERIRRGIAQFI